MKGDLLEDVLGFVYWGLQDERNRNQEIADDLLRQMEEHNLKTEGYGFGV